MWLAGGQLHHLYPSIEILITQQIGLVKKKTPKKEVEETGTSSFIEQEKGSIVDPTQISKTDNMTTVAPKDEDIGVTGTATTSDGNTPVISTKLSTIDDNGFMTTNNPEDENIGAAGTSFSLEGKPAVFSSKVSGTDFYKGIVTMHTPEDVDNGVIGLSYTQLPMDQDTSENSAQVVPSGDEEKNLWFGSNILRRTRKFFSDLHFPYQSLRYENLKYLMIIFSEILFCEVEDGKVVSGKMISVQYLPHYLRRAIADRLPTWKTMIVLSMEEKDLPPPDSTEVSTRVLSSWLRICETQDVIYFVDLTRVEEEPDDEMDVDFSTTSTDIDGEGEEPGPSAPKSSLAVADDQVCKGTLETAADFRIESIPPVAEHGDPQDASKQSCGLMAFIRNLWKK